MTLGQRLRIALAWGLGLGVLLVLCLAVAVDRFGQEERARPARVIVVLGSGVLPNGSPSADLKGRVDHAVDLWRRHLAPALLFTGAKLEGPVSQAESARRYARSLGVPRSACFVDQASRNTAENARDAVRIIRENGWRSAIVTSDPFHLLRARQLFREDGLEVATSPALDVKRNRSWPARAYWTLREVAALLDRPRLLVLGPVPNQRRE